MECGHHVPGSGLEPCRSIAGTGAPALSVWGQQLEVCVYGFAVSRVMTAQRKHDISSPVTACDEP